MCYLKTEVGSTVHSGAPGGSSLLNLLTLTMNGLVPALWLGQDVLGFGMVHIE